MRSVRLTVLAVCVSVLVLASLVSGCGNPRLAYVFVDDDQREYKLNMTVAEKGSNGETLGTVTIEALLRTGASIDPPHPSACFITVDYDDVKISTTGLAQRTGNQIPRAYFPLCLDRLVTVTGPARRGDDGSVELASVGANGSLTGSLLNTFVGKCFAQPLRDSLHEVRIGSQWTTILQSPGEFMTYLYTGKRPTGDQNKETTRVRVTGLTAEGAFAELAWSSITALQCTKQVALTETLLGSGMDPSEIADRTPAKGEATATMSVFGSSDCSGIAVVQTADGWPLRASVDRMTIDLTYLWSNYPEDLVPSEEAAPVGMILELTGSIEALF